MWIQLRAQYLLHIPSLVIYLTRHLPGRNITRDVRDCVLFRIYIAVILERLHQEIYVATILRILGIIHDRIQNITIRSHTQSTKQRGERNLSSNLLDIHAQLLL